MSPPDLRHRQSPISGERPDRRRKSVLFCPDCGHESLLDGDWVATDDRAARVRHIRCPVCETVVTNRPLLADTAAAKERDPSDPGTIRRALEVAVRVVRNALPR